MKYIYFHNKFGTLFDTFHTLLLKYSESSLLDITEHTNWMKDRIIDNMLSIFIEHKLSNYLDKEGKCCFKRGEEERDMIGHKYCHEKKNLAGKMCSTILLVSK